MMLLYSIFIVVAGLICISVGLDIKDWKYWAIMGCIFGGYVCGLLG